MLKRSESDTFIRKLGDVRVARERIYRGKLSPRERLAAFRSSPLSFSPLSPVIKEIITILFQSGRTRKERLSV